MITAEIIQTNEIAHKSRTSCNPFDPFAALKNEANEFGKIPTSINVNGLSAEDRAAMVNRKLFRPSPLMIGARTFHGLTNFITANERNVKNGGENKKFVGTTFEIVLSDCLRKLISRKMSPGRLSMVKDPN
jgi:hypothetical protein